MASRGINKVIILGNLGNNPETRYMPNGNAVTTISVATSESWTDKTTGQPQERTEWHRIEAFGKLAEIMGQYLKKGSQVYVEGSIRTDKWTDQQGVERYSTKVRADQMQMLGGKNDSSGDFSANQPKNSAPPQTAPNNFSPQAQKQANAPQAFKAPEIDDNFEDDIPF